MAGRRPARNNRPKGNGGRPNGRAKRRVPQRRSRGDVVLAQGMGRTVTRAFGAARARGCFLRGWDAFSPIHLPLPRALGAYAVVRTTRALRTDARVMIIGTYRGAEAPHQHVPLNPDCWSNVCAMSAVDPTQPINANHNTRCYSVPIPGLQQSAEEPLLGSGLTVTPAAISVQVINGNPLQTTAGMVFGAVCPAQMDMRASTRTWDDFGGEFISYMRPRMMSAGKLALRGVQADSYPLSMNQVSEFCPMHYTANNATMNWNVPTSGVGGSNITPAGWAPIVIVNTQAGLNLDYLITIEWRVRFDIGNPAVASHANHGYTPDSTWASMVDSASSKAHGMLDIVEKVANTGAAVASAAGRIAPLFG